MSHEKSTLSITNNKSVKDNLAKWLSWSLVGLVVLATIWGIKDAIHELTAGRVDIWELLSGISFRLFPVIFAILAALVINYQPTNLIGWLMALPVFGGIITFITESYFQNVVTSPSAPSSFFLLMIWINNTAWTLFIFPIILIPLFFPDGRPPSPRWNWVIYYADAVCLFFYGIATASKEFGPTDSGWTVTNPIGFASTEVLDRWVSLPWAIGLMMLVFVCIAALIVRFRRGTNVEKAQIKWVAYASMFFGVIYLTLLPISFSADNKFLNNLFNILFSFSLSVVPIGISIAILRYRLWDIDFVINRSLVYGALTALLAALLGVGLFIVSQLSQNFTGGPLLVVAVSATVFGAIFQPARRQLQRFVDRRFYHIEIDYQKTPPNLDSSGAIQPLRQTNFGVYKDLELIGHGGMAEVYKSLHPQLGELVAIKILPAHLAVEDEFRQRFIREAQVVAKLEHPNIVQVFDSGEQDGRYYIVMEYIDGKDLSEFIRANGRISLDQALPLIHQLSNSLDYAHSKGFIHRDIKPSNVLLDVSVKNKIRAVLTDFGIAKVIDAHTAMTRTGGILGTFDYMAPEQIQALDSINGKADIYALGVMVYQMLTGELPFKHNNPGALLIAHLNQPPPNPNNILPDLPYHVAHAIQRAMAKNPDQRFESAMEFSAEISGAVS